MAVTRIIGASRVAPGLFDDPEEFDDFTDLAGLVGGFVCWPRSKQTVPPVGDTLFRASTVVTGGKSTNLRVWADSIARVCKVYSADSIDLSASGVLGDVPEGNNLIIGTLPSRSTEVAETEDTVEDPAADTAEVGAPSSALLVEAVAQLRSWLRMPQKDIAAYVGISNSTVMAWRREAPRYPRHARIPVLLSLWSAVGAARAELGDEATAQLVWSHGEAGQVPATSPEDLAEQLLAAAAAASDDAWLAEDDYEPGVSPVPSEAELLDAEAALSAELRRGAGGSGYEGSTQG